MIMLQKLKKLTLGSGVLLSNDNDTERATEIFNEAMVNTLPGSTQDEAPEAWLNPMNEGQLSVDVYQTPFEIVIQTAVAGVRPEELEVIVQADMVTLRGQRQRESDLAGEDYLCHECYWGPFSRSVILPVEIYPDRATAMFKLGLLTIRLPKATHQQNLVIEVVDENL